MNKKQRKLVLIVSLTASIGMLGYILKFGIPKTYFFDLDDYLYFIAGLWIFVTLSLLIPGLSVPGQIVSVILLGSTGYALIEMIYSRFPIIIPPNGEHYFDLITGDLNYYLIHRSYQYIPLALMVLVLFYRRENSTDSFLKSGDWNIETRILDKNHPFPWKRVVLRISVIALVLATLALIVRIKCNSLIRPISDQIALFPSNVLGAANNCFIEEFLFRGILLTVFSKAIGQKWGNFLQAFLFGLVHFPSFNLWHYFAKIVVFTFLGWLFGRATIETGGIKSSWVIHTSIVVSMYLGQTV